MIQYIPPPDAPRIEPVDDHVCPRRDGLRESRPNSYAGVAGSSPAPAIIQKPRAQTELQGFYHVVSWARVVAPRAAIPGALLPTPRAQTGGMLPCSGSACLCDQRVPDVRGRSTGQAIGEYAVRIGGASVGAERLLAVDPGDAKALLGQSVHPVAPAEGEPAADPPDATDRGEGTPVGNRRDRVGSRYARDPE